MINKSNSQLMLISFIIISFVIVGFVKPVYPQSSESDSSFHPYHVNYWVTGSIIVGGLGLEKIGVPWISNKTTISEGELQNLNTDNISPIDHWALNFDPSRRVHYKELSSLLLSVSVFLPVITMLDKNIRRDWLDILLIYLQTQTISNNLYLYSPFGATFQNRLRPVVYYESIGIDERTSSNNRNSLYSGHVAATTAASFFTAKIFCDYHPELGWKKYLVYGAASIPPLLMSYFRLRALAHFPTDLMTGIGLGALCGILIPELHRVKDKNILLGVYSSPEATGIAVKWQPNFLK
jgi:membrane-associated phospholipid phosphatase